ncbi:TIGR03557 family F420-dependent LLM class oxidoreductase [Streptomyces sp. V4-01]|uniref:TIGR03557 family F420-dependent LLM class oxidoreductase n=1 Tax=Actinacidiphila polyblastidii TaxID=3110430 RepID=A0ABU7PE48_9ACTN|nr:TIGR03557 family F420-dependent LLM class oxidoreductase [Streptomyces sp. V4-01]
MTTYGYFLSSEEFAPGDLLEQARMAEQAGFESLAISDHFHPWNDEQGEASFVWAMIGALSQVTSLPITTLVTCPTVRMHPAVNAQAAATAAVLTGGRFRFGIGTGEALNEHILGDAWPEAAVRMTMLEEAVQVIRKLFAGDRVTHHGDHYTVQNARLYTVPGEPVPLYVSGFGPQAAALAGRIDTSGWPIADLEFRHRLRARAEDRIRAARATGLRNLPLHRTAQNRIWLEIVQIALDLLAWMPMLALTGKAKLWEPRRLRLRLFTTAGQLVTTGRRLILPLARHWPWTGHITAALDRLTHLPDTG